MKAEILQFVQEKTKELIQAPTCSAEARKAAEQWLALVGTEREAEETKAYLAELEEDIVTVDGLITFAESEAGQRCLVRIMQKKWLHMQESSKRQERHIVIVRPARQWRQSWKRKNFFCK